MKTLNTNSRTCNVIPAIRLTMPSDLSTTLKDHQATLAFFDRLDVIVADYEVACQHKLPNTLEVIQKEAAILKLISQPINGDYNAQEIRYKEAVRRRQDLNAQYK